MSDDSEITVKARRFSPRDEETIDLKHFDVIEITRGHHRMTVRIQDGRLILSADDALIVCPRAANMIEVQI